MTAVEEMEIVGSIIEEKLSKFDSAVESSNVLEIDSERMNPEINNTCLKILNHRSQIAFDVTLDAIIKQDVGSLINALETGETHKLSGVTRIVGYYSRTHNWNKSKIGELHDRHKGEYNV